MKNAMVSLLMTILLGVEYSQAQFIRIPLKMRLIDAAAATTMRNVILEDEKIAAQLALNITSLIAVNRLVETKMNSMEEISLDVSLMESRIKIYIENCAIYYDRNHSMSGLIPGVSAMKSRVDLLSFSHASKIRDLKEDIDDIFNSQNYMTEGERISLSLIVVKKAFELSLE